MNFLPSLLSSSQDYGHFIHTISSLSADWVFFNIRMRWTLFSQVLYAWREVLKHISRATSGYRKWLRWSLFVLWFEFQSASRLCPLKFEFQKTLLGQRDIYSVYVCFHFSFSRGSWDETSEFLFFWQSSCLNLRLNRNQNQCAHNLPVTQQILICNISD